jgi:hypothetical protein
MDWGMEKTFWFRLKNRPVLRKKILVYLIWRKQNRLVASSKRNQLLKLKRKKVVIVSITEIGM